MNTHELIDLAARTLLMEAPKGAGARYTNLQALSALHKVDVDWVRIFPTLDEAIDLLSAVMDRAHSIWEATE